jgi:hypothetical protein
MTDKKIRFTEEEWAALNNSSKNLTITPPNVILDCGNAKIVFDKQEIQVDDILDVYIKLKNYLNTFDNVYV